MKSASTTPIYALDLLANFDMLHPLSAISTFWPCHCGYKYATWSTWILIYQGNRSCFISLCTTRQQRLCISTASLHFGHRRRTPVAFHVSHCALGIWLWSSKTSHSSRTVYQRVLGAFCADLFVTDGCLLAFSCSLIGPRESHGAQL